MEFAYTDKVEGLKGRLAGMGSLSLVARRAAGIISFPWILARVSMARPFSQELLPFSKIRRISGTAPSTFHFPSSFRATDCRIQSFPDNCFVHR